jgi:hypothetical protein
MVEDNSNEVASVQGEATGLGTDVTNTAPTLDVKTVKRQTKMEEIRYELTDEEKLKKGSDLARLHRKIELLEEEKKDSASHYTSLIKAEKIELTRAAESIRTGCEYRSMAVETVSDYNTGTVTRFLKDTGVELDHRKMTNAEARIEIEITQNPAEEIKGEDEACEQALKEEAEAAEKPKKGKGKKKDQ